MTKMGLATLLAAYLAIQLYITKAKERQRQGKDVLVNQAYLGVTGRRTAVKLFSSTQFPMPHTHTHSHTHTHTHTHTHMHTQNDMTQNIYLQRSNLFHLR